MDGFDFLGSYAKRVFTSKPTVTTNIKTNTRIESNNFRTLQKKKNLHFGQSTEQAKVARVKEAEEHRKEKRTQTVMEKRSGDLFSNYMSAIGEKREAAKAKETGTGAVKQSRRDQLLRWKQEKEAMNNNAAKKRVPFKAPASVPQHYPSRIAPLPPLSLTSSAASKVEKSMLSRSNVSKNNENDDSEQRRVTRAMTKAQSSTQSVTKTMGAATSRLRNLRITAKPADVPAKGPVSAKSRKPISTHPSTSTKKSVSESIDLFPTAMDVQDEPQMEQCNTSTKYNKSPKSVSLSPTPTDAKLEKVQPTLQKKVKKPKGMQFDAKYVEYNDSFVKAGVLLQNYSDKWNKILVDRSDIPEEVIGQINSVIGQAQLLLDSKLPQFAELLYYYLSRHQDPGPVLSCDLEGWWDVAVISVEKVKQIFERLNRMEVNGWEDREEKQVPIKSKTTSGPMLKKFCTSNKDSETKSKPKPTSGLLAFLAKKRKNISPVDENVEESVTPKSKTPERQFEGGFFDIRSPVRMPCLAALAYHNSTSKLSRSIPRTPSRRQSEVSIRMLAVRKSMGSICKIGVLNNAAQEENFNSGEGSTTNNSNQDPCKEILYPATFRDNILRFLAKPSRYPYYLQPNVKYFVNRMKERLQLEFSHPRMHHFFR